MFTNPIIDINDGTTDHDYDLRSIDGTSSVYVDIASAQDTPGSIRISHQTSGSGIAQNRRSIVSLDQVVEDAAGQQDTLRAYVVLVNPLKVATTAQVVAQLTLLKNFLAKTGHIAKIVAAEI